MATRYEVIRTESAAYDCRVHVSLRYAPAPTPGMYLEDDKGQLFVVRGLPLADYETGKSCTLVVRSQPDTYERRNLLPVGGLETTHRRS